MSPLASASCVSSKRSPVSPTRVPIPESATHGPKS
jgi:hypothetical protein